MYRKRPSRHDGLPVCEPRRAVQLLRLRTACSIVGLRGNVAARLLKLERGEADVTFLAAAGLERLGERGVGTPLESDQWLPAAAQGAIGIECLAENARVLELLAAINRSEEHTSELQSLISISYAVFCLKKNKKNTIYSKNRRCTTNRKNTIN